MNKPTILIIVMPLLFLLGSCLSDKDMSVIDTVEFDDTGKPIRKGEPNTYINVALHFPTTDNYPKGVATRSLPDDYNKKETWVGNDYINDITVFMVIEPADGTPAYVDRISFGQLNFTSADFNQSSGLTADEPILAYAGDKVRFYALINASANLFNSLKNVSAENFDTEYRKVYTPTAGIAEVAKTHDGKDYVMMTNDIEIPVLKVAPNITKAEAKAGGTANNVTINVSRVASRALVTTAPTSKSITKIERYASNSSQTPTTLGSGYTFNILSKRYIVEENTDFDAKFTDPQYQEYKNRLGEPTISTQIVVTNVKYAIGQSGKSVYITKNGAVDKQSDKWITTPNWKTPENLYSYIPGNANTHSDNADLSNPISATEMDAYPDFEKLQLILESEENRKFVLPVTHPYEDANNDGEPETNGYRKGNTTFFEITVDFMPDRYYTQGAGNPTTPNAGDLLIPLYTPEPGANYNVVEQPGLSCPPGGLFLGEMDGFFYDSREVAEARGQRAIHYPTCRMKYVLWLNPNKLYEDTDGIAERILLSPTVRNQVYHLHINSFSAMGEPYNPLNPNDEPISENPKSPIDPKDELMSERTYISTTLNVIPWGIHEHEMDLGGILY